MALIATYKMDDLIDICERMMERSYCIYSNFPVAAILITDCGKLFTGCNVENSSYGLCICAERTAMVKAVSEGFRKFQACVVMTRSPQHVSPCGACRQFLSEFGLNMDIYMVSSSRQVNQTKLSDILPMAFGSDDLKEGCQANMRINTNK